MRMGRIPRRSFVWCFCPCCDRIFVVLAPFEAVTAPRSVQPNRCVDEETTQVGGGKGSADCLCKRSHEGERVTRQLSHNTLATALKYNGTWPVSKKKPLCVSLTTRPLLQTGIAFSNALRACECWSIAYPAGVSAKQC